MLDNSPYLPLEGRDDLLSKIANTLFTQVNGNQSVPRAIKESADHCQRAASASIIRLMADSEAHLFGTDTPPKPVIRPSREQSQDQLFVDTVLDIASTMWISPLKVFFFSLYLLKFV